MPPSESWENSQKSRAELNRAMVGAYQKGRVRLCFIILGTTNLQHGSAKLTLLMGQWDTNHRL